MGVKFGMVHGGLHAKLHPNRCNVLPLRGEKPQNRPLSMPKLNTGGLRCAQCCRKQRSNVLENESGIGNVVIRNVV